MARRGASGAGKREPGAGRTPSGGRRTATGGARLREPGAAPRLSHVGADGKARMVDVGEKAVTAREAVARGSVTMSALARKLIRTGAVKKGDPLQAARLAGILAAKRTSELIPLCHPLMLSHVSVDLTPTRTGYTIEARVRTTGQTGVEMEALTAVAVAALTIYDMLKAVDKDMVIGEIRLMEKRGGKSGAYRRMSIDDVIAPSRRPPQIRMLQSSNPSIVNESPVTNRQSSMDAGGGSMWITASTICGKRAISRSFTTCEIRCASCSGRSPSIHTCRSRNT